MANEGEGAQGGATGTQSGTEDDTTGQGSTGSDNGSENGAQGGAEDTKTGNNSNPLQAEVDRLKEQRRLADQRAGKAESELAQLRDKDLPALDKATRDLADANKRVEALQGTNRTLALKVAFLQDNTHTWHSPERAMKLLDMDGVEVDDDGTVHGLKDAINALAKSDAYLIKTESKDDKQSPPGTAAGNNGSSGGGAPDTAKLKKRLPVLNTRVTR